MLPWVLNGFSKITSLYSLCRLLQNQNLDRSMAGQDLTKIAWFTLLSFFAFFDKAVIDEATQAGVLRKFERLSAVI